MEVPHFADKQARALWHLELLGCHAPEDAVAPYIPGAQRTDDYWCPDDDVEGSYLGVVTCWSCGGEGNEINCCDDLCHGQGWCMHGDNRACRVCGGEGML